VLPGETRNAYRNRVNTPPTVTTPTDKNTRVFGGRTSYAGLPERFPDDGYRPPAPELVLHPQAAVPEQMRGCRENPAADVQTSSGIAGRID
jgi:hypothetical protein